MRDGLHIVTPPALILIHGFAQGPESWQPVVQLLGSERRVFAPPMRGHGAGGLSTGVPSFDGVRGDLCELIEAEHLDRVVLWGYSQGARIALDFVLALPAGVAAVVLESGTAGIEDETARDARRIADSGLADWIEHHSAEEFAAHWESQPIFASQSPAAVAQQRTIRAGHDPMALAAALRGLGQAAFDPVWHRLREVKVPALLLSGAGDATYTELAARMTDRLANATHVVVEGSGHSVHLEAPDLAVTEVAAFLERNGL